MASINPRAIICKRAAIGSLSVTEVIHLVMKPVWVSPMSSIFNKEILVFWNYLAVYIC